MKSLVSLGGMGLHDTTVNCTIRKLFLPMLCRDHRRGSATPQQLGSPGLLRATPSLKRCRGSLQLSIRDHPGPCLEVLPTDLGRGRAMRLHPHSLVGEPGAFPEACNCTLAGTAAEEGQLCVQEEGLLCFDHAIIKASTG